MSVMEAERPTDVPRWTRLTPEQADMVAANTGLISLVVKPHMVDYDDAFQDGVLGLARATQKFDPSKGFKFSTYAYQWIRQAVNEGRTIRSEHGQKNARRVYGYGNADPDSLPVLVSLDAAVAGEGSSDFLDLLSSVDDVEDDALRGVVVPVFDMLHAVAHDERDHQLVDLLERGVRPTSVEASAAMGITRKAIRMRLGRLSARLRHPTMREFVKRHGVA